MAEGFKTTEECRAIFDSIVEQAKTLLSIARDTAMQRAAANECDNFIKNAKEWRKTALETHGEDYANELLAFRWMAVALRDELSLWIKLKEGNPDEAWVSLVDAQTAACNAMRSHPTAASLAEYTERLASIEKLIFPPQVFVSCGTIVKRSTCSICGVSYGDCSHLVGLPYLGELCFEIVEDFDLREISIVDNPADKSCRVTEFAIDGVIRSRMTWAILRKAKTGEERTASMLAHRPGVANHRATFVKTNEFPGALN